MIKTLRKIYTIPFLPFIIIGVLHILYSVLKQEGYVGLYLFLGDKDEVRKQSESYVKKYNIELISIVFSTVAWLLFIIKFR